jgi:hypothetical protein
MWKAFEEFLNNPGSDLGISDLLVFAERDCALPVRIITYAVDLEADTRVFPKCLNLATQ